jgi:hypothetical protein
MATKRKTKRRSSRSLPPKPSTTPWWAVAGLVVLAVVAIALVVAAMQS